MDVYEEAALRRVCAMRLVSGRSRSCSKGPGPEGWIDPSVQGIQGLLQSVCDNGRRRWQSTWSSYSKVLLVSSWAPDGARLPQVCRVCVWRRRTDRQLEEKKTATSECPRGQMRERQSPALDSVSPPISQSAHQTSNPPALTCTGERKQRKGRWGE